MKEYFPTATIIYKEITEKRNISPDNAISWFEKSYSKYGVDRQLFLTAFSSRTIDWKNTAAIIRSNTRGRKTAKENEHREVRELVHGQKEE